MTIDGKKQIKRITIEAEIGLHVDGEVSLASMEVT